MKLTSDPCRIEKAHHLLQRLEDEIFGAMSPVSHKTAEEVNKIFVKRLGTVYDEVWKIIKLLNEAYDKDTK